VSYAPSLGTLDIRKQWKAMLGKKNSGLTGKTFSLPVVTSALTHGLSTCGYLFCDPGDAIILADLFWENYELVFSRACGARLDTFAMFTEQGRFNVAGLRARLMAGPVGKKIVCLNFPNNPTGAVASREQLQRWVDYALANQALILFDAAYEAFIRDPELPHSIYEIEGAKRCAIEFRSFSKNAGFTGTRCALTVVPRGLMGVGGRWAREVEAGGASGTGARAPSSSG